LVRLPSSSHQAFCDSVSVCAGGTQDDKVSVVCAKAAAGNSEISEAAASMANAGRAARAARREIEAIEGLLRGKGGRVFGTA
jgi:hypothetical protein